MLTTIGVDNKTGPVDSVLHTDAVETKETDDVIDFFIFIFIIYFTQLRVYIQYNKICSNSKVHGIDKALNFTNKC